MYSAFLWCRLGTFPTASTLLASFCNLPYRRLLLFAGIFYFSTYSCALCEEDPVPSTKSSLPPPVTEILIQGAPFHQPLMEVPQSTTVVTTTLLENKGSTAFQDSIDSIPGLAFAGGTSRPRFFLIRGVGELEQYVGAPNPSVASIIDDIDFSGLGIVTPLFDIEQVEVLRGPQGIRFGSSALGGAISVKSNDPTPFTSGTVQVSKGNDELTSGAAAVGGAIPGTDQKLQVRFAAFSSRSDGFRSNPFLMRDDTNKRDESLARMKVKYDANSWLTFDAAGWIVSSNNGYDAFSIDNSLTTQSDRPGRDDVGVQASSLKTTALLPHNIKLVDIASIARTHQGYAYDGDWGNNPFWGVNAPYDYFSDTVRTRRTIANELRLLSDDPNYEHGESYRWTTGVYFQRLTEDSATTQLSNDEIYDSLQTAYRANTSATFGQIEVPLGMKTDFTSGVRVEQRNATYGDSQNSAFSPTYTMLGGNASVSHDIYENVRGYLSASRGFKGGGFNAGPSVPQGRRRYDPEYLWNFETGVKGAWLEKRLTTNVALYYEQRRSQQLKLGIQDNPADPLSFTYITESTAQGRGAGVELESSLRLLPEWEVFASGSVMDTKYTSAPVELQGLKGRGFSHAPSWQFSTGTQASLGGGVFSRIEVTGRNSFYFDDAHNQNSNPYTLLNASVGWRASGWRVIAWGRNLANENYAVRGFFFGNEPPDFPNKKYIQRGDPRAYGITVGYDF